MRLKVDSTETEPPLARGIDLDLQGPETRRFFFPPFLLSSAFRQAYLIYMHTLIHLYIQRRRPATHVNHRVASSPGDWLAAPPREIWAGWLVGWSVGRALFQGFPTFTTHGINLKGLCH